MSLINLFQHWSLSQKWFILQLYLCFDNSACPLTKIKIHLLFFLRRGKHSNFLWGWLTMCFFSSSQTSHTYVLQRISKQSEVFLKSEQTSDFYMFIHWLQRPLWWRYIEHAKPHQSGHLNPVNSGQYKVFQRKVNETSQW